MDWANHIITRFSSTRDQWCVANPYQSAPRFWELDFKPDDADLIDAQKAIAQSIESHTACVPNAAVIILLSLLRYQLSNVRINNLWPELARLLSTDDLKVDPSRCGNFFRAMLRSSSDVIMPKVHNRYIAWCLDEAATGCNRTEVVTNFLSILLEDVISHDSEDTADIVADRLVKSFIKYSRGTEEIAVYQSHLLRTGRTVVSLVRELKTGNAFHELGIWNWNQLRNWWRNLSGEDLDRLTPETRNVLSHLLSKWEDRISRSSLARLVSLSDLRLELPPSLEMINPNDIPHLALGPIRLHMASGIKDVQLCEDNGLISQQIMAYKEDCWHPIGNFGALAWSRKPFHVRTEDGNQHVSVPFYCGNSINESSFVGEYWSSPSGRLALPEVIDQTFGSKVPCRLRIRYQFCLGYQGLRIRVFGFSTNVVLAAAKSQLYLNSRLIWEGTLPDSKAVGFKTGLELQLDNEDATFTLLDVFGKELCHTAISSPLKSESFISLNGQIQRHFTVGLDRHVFRSEDKFPAGIIIAVSSNCLPTATNATVVPVDYKVPTAGFRLYQIKPLDNSCESVIAVAGSNQWELVHAQPVQVLNSTQNITTNNGIEIFSTESIELLKQSSELLIRVPMTWLNNYLIERSSFRLVLESATIRQHWNASELLPYVMEGNDGIVPLLEVAKKTGVKLPAGLIHIYAQRPHTGRSEPVCIYRYPEVIESLSGNIDETSYLRLSHDDLPPQLVRSQRVVSLDDVIGDQKSDGWIDCGHDGAIGFRWHPRISDVLLRVGDLQVPPAPNLCIKVSEQPISLEVYDEPNISWAATVGSVSRNMFSAERLDIVRMLVEALTVEPDLGCEQMFLASRLVVGEFSAAKRQWCFDLRPSDIQFAATWRAAEESWYVDITITWLGLCGFELEAIYKDSNEFKLSQLKIDSSITNHASQQPYSRHVFNHRLTIEACTTFSIDPSDPGSITIQHGILPLAQYSLPPIPDEILNSRPVVDVKTAFRRCVSQLGIKPSNDDELLTRMTILCERYFRQNFDLPFTNLDAIISKMVDIGTDSCRRQAISCLRIMDMLVHSCSEHLNYVTFDEAGPLRLMVASLAAVRQTRLLKLGLASPQEINKLIVVFDSHATNHVSSLGRDWARGMSLFCRYLMVGQNGIDVDDEFIRITKQQMLRNPIIGCDAFLNNWMANTEEQG